MSLSITQTPAVVSLAQSPIIFTVAESNAQLRASASFQYVGELYYWQGGPNASSSVANYTINKYKNTSNVGIFDLNRIINSTLTDYLEANPSNVEYFAVDFYTQYRAGGLYVTGSHVRSATYKALDGYSIFQEPIGQSVYNKTPYWPLMTDGPATQSCFTTNYGLAGVYGGDAGTTTPTKVRYVGNTGTGDFTLSANVSSSGQIQNYPIGPSEPGFPLPSLGLSYFTTQAYNGSTPLGLPIKYEVDCLQKYPNVRIKWKNRYGQFDFFNFYMVNRQSFTTEKKTYQPQLGTWEGSSLSYQDYDSGVLNYIVDSKQAISVNSYWIDENYNDILKQLLVSDEIYWVYDEANNLVRPLTITTQNIQFKTNVNDHLIQYQFDFNYGQAYKLII
jgi:hypothetical protein